MRFLRGRWLAIVALAMAAFVAAQVVQASEHPEHPEHPAGEESPTVREFVIEYSADMEVPESAEEAYLWMPVPRTAPHQEVSGLEIQSNGEHRIVRDPDYDNRILRVKATGPGRKLTARVSARIRRESCRALEERAAPIHRAGKKLSLFTGPNQLVPLEGPPEEEAERVLRPGMSDRQKARALYEHLNRTFEYDKTVPGYGKGDVLRACDVRKGNCSDVHSLFIAMSRTSDLPARFLIGFPIGKEQQGTVGGYHCWAEFYLDGTGWVPVDISEAIKDPSRRNELFGGLDANRVMFTIGRDIRLTPEPAPSRQNILIYPVGLIDGEMQDDVAWKLSYRDVEE